ncbi:MAG TPA: cyclic nucleotide-binding domain-containing protein [Gaiellaceae bacterium]|nr:cyclic nucleotide-binding domain-containing protein [Gaiellaceae bacterium]
MDAAQLASISLFADLTADQRQTIARTCEEIEIDAGATLVREGDFGFAAYAIQEGMAEVRHDGGVVRTLGPGDLFGEIAILSGGRRTASVVATTPMKLVVVLNRDMWRLERESPEVAAALRATVDERLGHDLR